ncbi:hypothetical protein FJT64_025362 [Amphibalanus amphitrite]|uniref:Peptidase M12A domain-containing protein n=1 Tax=Amphibalanus amphitrite TaxID=1232801 RepID=A0A6A4W937_AMPAM|nr:hypothetical protein FJT64_025362 [Amphibalanus amphitrite]
MRDDKVTIPYFFSEAKPPFDSAEKWMAMAFEEVNSKTCVVIEQARGVVGGDCKTPVPQVTNAICIESGDGCYSLLGTGSNPQRIVINETCLSPSMSLRLITLAVGLGYQLMHSNFMLADKGVRAEHGYCFTAEPELSDRFDVKSASAVGFTIEAGSSDYEAIHVTPRPEDQALLHNRKNTFFGLRRVDVAQINDFNKCEEKVYGQKCRSQLRVCQKRTAKYPNVMGLTKDCKCRCRDGWEGVTCSTASKKEEVPKGFYGCHKKILLRRGHAGGVTYFRLKDIELDIVSEPPYLCTITIQSKWRDLGFYCRGYAPVIRVDASALYKQLRSQGVLPFSMRDACERFRLYFQSGVHKYRRRVLCSDAVLQSGGYMMLRARGPNTTLFFVMKPENETEAEALLQIQVGIQKRLYVPCDTLLYYRNPLSFNVHRSEFQFHAKYLIEFLIGIVVFMVISYVAYDYWMTRRRVEQMRRRRQAKLAAEKTEESSSDSSELEMSCGSSKSTHKTQESMAGSPKPPGASAHVSKTTISLSSDNQSGAPSTREASPEPDDSPPSSKPSSSKWSSSKSSSKPSASKGSSGGPSASKASSGGPNASKAGSGGPSSSKSSSGGPSIKAQRRPTLKEIADQQPKVKKKKEEKNALPPILAQKAKVRQTSDLDGGSRSSPDVEEPAAFLSQLSTKASTPPPSATPPQQQKRQMKRLSTRKGKKAGKKKKGRGGGGGGGSSSSSSSSDETFKQALKRYISEKMHPSESEDDESAPA